MALSSATKSSTFLKHLEPAVRPGFAGSLAPPQVPLEEQRFEALLQLVSRGEIQSGRHVDVQFDPAEELDADQLDRLSSAADLAEARGARQALMLIDGRGLVLDVDQRSLTAELSADRTDAVVDLDTAVYVAGPNDATATAVHGPQATIIPDVVPERIDTSRRAG